MMNLVFIQNTIIDIKNKYPYIPPYKKTLEYIVNNKLNNNSLDFVGNNARIFLDLKKPPTRAMNDWWLYSLPEAFETKYLINQHRLLLNKNPGHIFWINNKLLNSESSRKNKYLKEILKNSIKIKDQSYFTMFKIK